MARSNPLPLSLPPRLLNLQQAAAYLSLSATKFAGLVKDGRMPPPRRIDGRRAWDVRDLDAAVDDLPVEGEEAGAADASWDDLG